MHLFFRRGREPKYGMDERAPGLERLEPGISQWNSVYVTFYSPRTGAPLKTRSNHFRFPLTMHSFFQEMVHILRLIETEFSDRHVVVHLGWPLSSWFDRVSMGIMYLRLLRLPWIFPSFGFIMRYTTRVALPLARLSQEKSSQKTQKIKKAGHNPSSPPTDSGRSPR